MQRGRVELSAEDRRGEGGFDKVESPQPRFSQNISQHSTAYCEAGAQGQMRSVKAS